MAKRAAKKKRKVSREKADWFWPLVEKFREGEDYEVEALTHALAQRSTDDILAFGHRVYALLDESYRGNLWGAAYIINGGCSDDGFEYFRGWLISRGKKVYEAALEDPDSLARAAGEGDVELEEMLSVAADAWKLKTGKDDFYEHTHKTKRKRATELDLSWAEDGEGIAEQLAKDFPKLWKKFSAD